MKRRATNGTLLITVMFAAVLLDGCGKGQQHSAAPLKLSISRWIGYGPLLVAKEKHFFGGLDVDIQFIDELAVRRSALLSGRVDGWGSTVDNLAIDATVGVAGKTVMCIDESVGADGILVKPTIDWNNLKGKRVAVEKEFPGHFLLLTLLKQHGLKSSDVDVVDVAGAKMGEALASANADAAVTWEPWISKAPLLAQNKRLFTTAEQPGLIIDTLVIRDSVLTSRPADARTLAEGCLRAIDLLKTDPNEGNAIIAAAFQLSSEEVKNMLAGVRFTDRQRNLELMGSGTSHGPIYQLFDSAVALWTDAGVVQASPLVKADRYIHSLVQ